MAWHTTPMGRKETRPKWRADTSADRPDEPGQRGYAQRPPSPGIAGRRWWPVLAPLAIVAIGASLITSGGRHQWALSIFRQPTPYTALSFNRAWALPATAVRNQPVAISFAINNQEGQAVSYRYVLSESAGGVSQTLGGSSRTVAAGATWSVSTVVRPDCGSSPCRVEVSLPGHPETIDFLVTLRP
jgi:hypothetical protein